MNIYERSSKKKKVSIIVLIVALVTSSIGIVYGEETPEPIISDDSDVTVTAKPEDSQIDIVVPTEDNGIVSNKPIAQNPNPPTEEEVSNTDTNNMITDNSNSSTDIDNDFDGNGTTIAPQTGDATDVGFLLVTVLSCLVIVLCVNKYKYVKW